MENRKHVIIFAIIVFLSWPLSSVFAYGVDTHAYLTQEIVDFYNKNFPDKKISSEFKNFLIDGSRREDDAPRWMNHFYDPVNDRGLQSVYGNGYKSKEWAVSSNDQNNLKYKATTFLASILTAIQQRSISAITTETDFTWGRAIQFYANGEKEKALFILGHVLHLLEDVSVPDHTRNDPHPAGSPYEQWAARYNLSNPDSNLDKNVKQPISLTAADSYINQLADYSNKNFYSKDTIGIQSGYQNPVPDYDEKIGPYLYAIKSDKEGDFKLFLRKREAMLGYVVSDKNNLVLNLKENGGDLVLKDYWSRLSPKAVQYGAGMLNLFFTEANKAKVDKNFNKDTSFFGKIVGTAKNLAGNLISFVDSLFGSNTETEEIKLETDNSLKENQNQSDNSQKSEAEETKLNFAAENSIVPEVDLVPEAVQTDKKTDETTPEENKNLVKDKKTEESQENKKPAPEPSKNAGYASTTSVLATEVRCAFDSSKSASQTGVIINEVAWMGGLNGTSDEWIELKNISGNELNISNWQLINQGEHIKISLKPGTKISGRGFLLLERGENATPIKSDLLYTGSLKNSSEALQLLDSNCNLVDQVVAAPSWPAGDNESKRTMERNIDDLNWHTSSVIGGTPKAENSAPYVSVAAPQNGGGGGVTSAPVPSQEVRQENSSLESNLSNLNHVVISEIMVGTEASSSDEFIELYNPTAKTLDLTGWYVKRKAAPTSSENNLVSKASDAFAGKSIKPNGFFLIGSNQFSGKTADVKYSQNSTYLAENGDVILLYNSSDSIVDQINYGEISNGKSWERKAFSGNCVSAQNSGEFLGNGCDTDNTVDFELRDVPNPQNSSSLSEPRAAPQAVSDFDVSFSSSTLELIFNWKVNSSTTSYEIAENSNDRSIYKGTGSEFRQQIKEVGKTYEFKIKALDSDGLSSEPSYASTTTDFLDLLFYKSPTSSIYAGKPVIELNYESYPFFPNIFGGSHNYLVFYLNHDPEQDAVLEGKNVFMPKDISHVLKTSYATCGYLSDSPHEILDIENDISNRENCVGGMRATRLNFKNVGTSSIVVATDREMFKTGDYMTVAYYSGRSESSADLIAIDKKEYLFSEQMASHNAPALTPPLVFNFDKPNAKLRVDWAEAADTDTARDLITYEINVSTSTEFDEKNWKNIWNETYQTLGVTPGDSYKIGVRAKDEFGLNSDIISSSWSYPEMKFFIEQLNQEALGGHWGERNINCRFCFNNGISSAAYQSIIPEEDFEFNKVVLKFESGGIRNWGLTKLSVYEDIDNKPDFSKKLGETVAGDFLFSSPIKTFKDSKYWLVLEVNHSNPDTYQRSFFQNTVSSDDSYQRGESGTGPSGICEDISFCPAVNLSSRDWYMRIGME